MVSNLSDIYSQLATVSPKLFPPQSCPQMGGDHPLGRHPPTTLSCLSLSQHITSLVDISLARKFWQHRAELFELAGGNPTR